MNLTYLLSSDLNYPKVSMSIGIPVKFADSNASISAHPRIRIMSARRKFRVKRPINVAHETKKGCDDQIY